ncbi:unnamed protein product, partial [Discosporangium mesarthrocarpum]
GGRPIGAGAGAGARTQAGGTQGNRGGARAGKETPGVSSVPTRAGLTSTSPRHDTREPWLEDGAQEAGGVGGTKPRHSSLPGAQAIEEAVELVELQDGPPLAGARVEVVPATHEPLVASDCVGDNLDNRGCLRDVPDMFAEDILSQPEPAATMSAPAVVTHGEGHRGGEEASPPSACTSSSTGSLQLGSLLVAETVAKELVLEGDGIAVGSQGVRVPSSMSTGLGNGVGSDSGDGVDGGAGMTEGRIPETLKEKNIPVKGEVHGQGQGQGRGRGSQDMWIRKERKRQGEGIIDLGPLPHPQAGDTGAGCVRESEATLSQPDTDVTSPKEGGVNPGVGPGEPPYADALEDQAGKVKEEPEILVPESEPLGGDGA